MEQQPLIGGTMSSAICSDYAQAYEFNNQRAMLAAALMRGEAERPVMERLLVRRDDLKTVIERSEEELASLNTIIEKLETQPELAEIIKLMEKY